MKIKKNLVISVSVLVLLLIAGLYYFANITGNAIDSGIGTYCDKKIGTVLFTGSSNSLTLQNNRSVLCFESNLYDCGNATLIGGANTNLTEAKHGQAIGDWKCSLNNGLWVPSSGCVFNFTTVATSQSHSYNNTFGFINSTTASSVVFAVLQSVFTRTSVVLPFDNRYYCLDGKEYECAWDKSTPSAAEDLVDGAIVGSYKCFNTSGASRFFSADSSCISYIPARGKFVFGSSNSIGLKEILVSNLDPKNDLTIDSDNRYLCYNNQKYFCGVSEEPGFAQTTQNSSLIANSWRCNNGGWEVVGPTLNSGSAITNCACGSSCGPFNFSFASGVSSTFKFNVELVYSLVNGNSVSENFDVDRSGYNSNTGKSFGVANPTINCFNKPALVTSVNIKIKNANSYANSISQLVNVGYPSGCTNECNTTGTNKCSLDSLGTQTCGQYDTDQCLEYGPVSTCYPDVCSKGLCVEGQENTCTGICASGNLPINSSVASGDCGLSSQTCFTCNEGFSWNGSVCKLTNCTTGTHFYNETCISNNCGNLAPTGSNIINGTNSIISGASQNWTYVYLPINLGACQWSCNAGFKQNGTTNTCMVGKNNCANLGGACYNGSSLPNSSVNMSSYGSCTNPADSCLVCNSSGNLTKNSVGEFVSCVPIVTPKNCTNKCAYGGACFREGFRLENSSGNFFCNGTRGAFVTQKADGWSCSASFECSNNYCDKKTNKCIDLKEERDGRSGFWQKVLCFFQHGYGSQGYNSCLANFIQEGAA